MKWGLLLLIGMLSGFLFPLYSHLDFFRVKAFCDPVVRNLNTGMNYTTIQSAIDANETLNGHTICVGRGIYFEDIVIDKALEMVGEDKYSTIIDGLGLESTIYIIANNVTVRNLTIQDSQRVFPGSGIYVYSNYDTISDNLIRNNTSGIYSYNSHDNLFVDNEVSVASFGIWLDHESCNNTVAGNEIHSNSQFGLYAGLYSNRNRVWGNTFRENYFAVGLSDAESNLFSDNNFMDKANQTIVYLSMSQWDDGYEGNYWGDYTGTDANQDGLGDMPYQIDLNNRDGHPLMGMFRSFGGSDDCGVSVVSNLTVIGCACSVGGVVGLVVVNGSAGQAAGFCRVCIPIVLLDVGNLSVQVDGGLTPLTYQNLSLADDGARRYIYFTFSLTASPQPTHTITITPEHQTLHTITLLCVSALLIIAVRKRLAITERGDCVGDRCLLRTVVWSDDSRTILY